MNKDNLETWSDVELAERFALEFAGWYSVPLTSSDKRDKVVVRLEQAEVKLPGQQPFTPRYRRFSNGSTGGDRLGLLSADAVLSVDALMPFLMAVGYWKSATTKNTGEDQQTTIVLGFREIHAAAATTFARAACIALLRSTISA